MTPANRARGGESRFVSNTTALAVSAVVSTALTLAQVKILAAWLLPGTFGAFAALRGFSLLLAMLASNGFPQLLVRFLPFHESKNQMAKSIALSGVCFLLPLLFLAIAVFVVELNRSFFFSFLFSTIPIGGDDSGQLFLWFYCTTLGVTLKLVLYGGFNGLRRLPLQVALEVASLAAQVVWVFLWREQLDLARLFMILGATSLATSVVGFPLYFVRLQRDISRRGTPADGTATGVGYGGYWLGAAGMSMVAVAFTDVDRYVLSRVLALEVLSQFHIGSRLLRLTNRVLSVPVLAFQPEVSRLEAENRERSIVDTTRVFFKFNTAFATLAAFALAALSPELVRLVANEQYAAAAPLLRILAISVPLTAMTAPLTAVMKALDQVSRALFCDLAWAVSYVALLLYLGGTFGLTGVGAAQVLASLLQLTLALRLGRVKPALADVASTALKCLICGVVAFAPVLAAGLFLQSQTASMVVKLLLMLPAVLLFRLIAVKGLGLFNDGDRHALVSLLERRGMGAVARRLV